MIQLMKSSFSWLIVGVAAIASAVASQTANAQSITFEQQRLNRTNMTNLGDAGFWFAQFDAAAPISGAAINNNDRNSLPSWVTINPTPDTTFASSATTKGGQPSWATLTLPDGEVGLSGAVVDANTANNSNNTIRQLDLGPGTPPRFRFYVVTDNTAGEHDPATRLRARGQSLDPPTFDISGPNAPGTLAANMNGSPDVYSWIYQGFGAGDFIKLQINSGNAAEPASIAGIMFDVIPEPSSAMMLLLGTALGLARQRRRG
jgi:PEP-CTERM motif-containing protein